MDKKSPSVAQKKGNATQSSIDKDIDKLLKIAEVDALSRLPSEADEKAKKKILNAIQKRLRPHIRENEIIAEQLNQPKYKAFVKEIKDFLNTQIGITACSDGRIAPLAFFAPRVAHIHRRLQGLPETRRSTKGDKNVSMIDDAMILGAIKFAIATKQQEQKDKPELVEFLGPHIQSVDPIEGCGAAKGGVTLQGRPAKTAMQFGAIIEYFQKLGNGFNAFNTIIKRSGGIGTTFDAIHDIYSQGLIFGIKQLYDTGAEFFDENISLRDNLVSLHNQKKILMTELLDAIVKDEILQEARKLGFTKTLLIEDATKLTTHVMLIARTAKMLTERYERQGFPWLPSILKEGASSLAIRTLAFLAISNCVYRILSNIIPGKHSLLEHPEKLVRVGSIGAAFNVENISFIQVTPHRELRPEDVSGTQALYRLLEGVAPHVGINLENEARIILVAEEYNRSHYSSDVIAQKELLEISSVVSNNAARLREVFQEGVAAGETVIFGILHEGGSRKIVQLISSFSTQEAIG